MKLKTKKSNRLAGLNVGNGTLQVVPLKLNLGAGPTKMEGFLSVDRIKFPTVDVVLDLVKPYSDLAFRKSKYEPWPWKDGSVDEIHCSHTIEHFDGQERVHIYNEMFRVLKVGAKATLVAPHWASGRAYGDPTHKWPPISGFSFFYLLKSWRMGNAPHTDIDHWANGYACDFDATWGFSLHPLVASRNQEYQQFALLHYTEAAQDIVCTLTKRPPC